MAQYEVKYPWDYRSGGDTIDDVSQKYIKEIDRIYQFLNNLREHNSNGTEQIEPQPYMFKVTDNKLYIRNGANNAWLYLFDIAYRMGMSDNSEAVILTTDDVTTTSEALKLVKTNADGDIDADITGNAYKFGNKTADQYITVDDVSDAGVALKIVKTDSNGVAHISISGSAVQLNNKPASYYLNEDDLATVPSGSAVTHDINKLVKTNANGILPVDIAGNAAQIAGINTEINNLQDGQVLTFRAASRSWRNEDKGVVGSGRALAVYDGSTLQFEYDGDAPQSLDLGTTATNTKIDTLTGQALRETAFSLGDTARLPGLPVTMYLECTTPGTTGATAPVITTVTEGQTISDGTVVWTVRACASKAFVTQRFLPLSGGLLTNYKIGRNIDTGEIMLVSGADYGDGACLLARGKNYPIESASGSFQLEARIDASTYAQLIGTPSGDLTWQTNSLDKAAVIQENMGSNGYRQTADGFTVCWGIKATDVANTGEFTIVYPISFANEVIAVVPTMVNNGTAAVPCEFVIRSMNESQATVAWRTYNGTTNVNGGVFLVAFGR